MKILITGATGLVGQKLGLALQGKGHSIIAISRDAKSAKVNLPFQCEVIEGDLGAAPVEIKADIDVVVHLAGEPIAEGRWSEERKKRIRSSRVLSTRNLISSLKSSPKLILCASAIGYYGDRQKEMLDEASSPGSDFLAQVCVEWEEELLKAKLKFGDQTALTRLRLGVVLARQGGALAKMLFPFRAGVGAPIGSGEQFMSWIHIDDLIDMMCFLIEKNLPGLFNGVAPEPVTNREFSATLAHTLHRPLGPKIPAFMMKILFGEMANAILASQKVSNTKISQSGFSFKFKNLDLALSDLLAPLKETNEVFESEQFVPQKKSEIFEYFSEAKNLEALTPDILHFHIKTMSTPVIERGTLIDYKLKVHGIPLKWKTLIDEWNPSSDFTDLQLKGPYRLWRHVHEFLEVDGGTIIKDKVSFQLPGGYFGWLFGSSFVRADVRKIFAFRRKTIFEKFVQKGSH